MPEVDCPDCEWTATYATRQSAANGRHRHANKTGHKFIDHRLRTEPRPVLPTRAERDDDRWRARVDAAGYVQPTPEQMVTRWNERPELYDDLLRVLAGDSLAVTERERRRSA
jgi:hypothetical protein